MILLDEVTFLDNEDFAQLVFQQHRSEEMLKRISPLIKESEEIYNKIVTSLVSDPTSYPANFNAMQSYLAMTDNGLDTTERRNRFKTITLQSLSDGHDIITKEFNQFRECLDSINSKISDMKHSFSSNSVNSYLSSVVSTLKRLKQNHIRITASMSADLVRAITINMTPALLNGYKCYDLAINRFNKSARNTEQLQTYQLKMLNGQCNSYTQFESPYYNNLYTQYETLMVNLPVKIRDSISPPMQETNDPYSIINPMCTLQDIAGESNQVAQQPSTLPTSIPARITTYKDGKKKYKVETIV